MLQKSALCLMRTNKGNFVDNRTYLSTVEEVENRIPNINRFPKEENIPDGMIECPTCGGHGVLVAMAHTDQLTIVCPCCKGNGVVDDEFLVRMKQGMDLFLIRKTYDVHVLTAAETLKMSASHINDIERGFCETEDYEKLRRTYLKEFAGIELPQGEKNYQPLKANKVEESFANGELTWDTFYILGAIGRNGESLTTTWLGERKTMMHAVLTGVHETNIPFWNAPVPKGAKIHPIPVDENPSAYAHKIGGIYAFGWYYPEGIERENSV